MSFFQNKKLLSNNLNEAQDKAALSAEISSLELSKTSTSA
jgi:hypothetical protein